MKQLKWIVSILVIIFPSFYFGYIGKSTEMGLAIVSGALASVFINLDLFAEFKGAGFEAKLKDTVKQAEVTIEKIRELIQPIVLLSIHEITHYGRLGSGQRDREILFNKLAKTITQLNLDSEDAIKEKIMEYHRYTAIDILGPFTSSIPYGLGENYKILLDKVRVDLSSGCALHSKHTLLGLCKEHNYDIPTAGIEAMEKYADYIKQYSIPTV